MLAQIGRRLNRHVGPRLFAFGMNLWPPLFFSGIKIESISADWHHIRVSLALRWYNRNYVGTQFGGALYMMTDPFFMLMFMRLLGRDYIVWDRSANINFIAPGYSKVWVDFHVNESDISQVKSEVLEHGKTHWHRTVSILDSDQKLIAKVDKVIYVRRKDAQR